MREGKLADAERFFTERVELANSPASALARATTLASVYNWLRQQPEAAKAIVNEQLARFPMDSIPPNERPYLNLADHFLFTGQVDRAKSLFSEYEDTIDPAVRETQTLRFRVAGHIAAAEGDYEEALRQFRTRDGMLQNPLTCLWDIAHAYDQIGNTDSTLAVLTRFVETPYYGKYTSEAWFLAPTLKRLGELYEERGDVENAVRYYNEFVELWKDADPELQPQVEDVRQRIVRLVGER
jgi:tetratricopeptide (TPR) repeat protein